MEAARRSRFLRRIEALVATAATPVPAMVDAMVGARRAAADGEEEQEQEEEEDGDQSRWYSSFLDKVERVDHE